MPYFSPVKVNGFSAKETRGTWEVNGDFMGGPFINYILVIIWICYNNNMLIKELKIQNEVVILDKILTLLLFLKTKCIDGSWLIVLKKFVLDPKQIKQKMYS